MQLYTVDRANRTLPLVRRIVDDIVREHERWQDAIARLDLLMSNSDTVDLRVVALEREVQAIARDIDAFQGELEALDIQLKDRRLGLVDFPTEIDGRRALLCWRLGEPSVQFWHDEDAGFAGRQPLSPTLVG
ncbi:MAG TPA: DUF2203 domain-containing protein [Gemmatimonadaceae bacterium]|nr:DUF2203 domain-containing protein [Gemmatimonadaceae bacterium]